MIFISTLSTSRPSASREAYVTDTSFVNPLIVPMVVPDAISVEPRVGAEYDAVELIATHALPDHAYMIESIELKYIAPVVRGLPSLSTVGGVDFAPRYLSSKASYEAAAELALVAALTADVAAALADAAAFVSDVAAAVALAAADVALVAAAVALAAELVALVAAAVAEAAAEVALVAAAVALAAAAEVEAAADAADVAAALSLAAALVALVAAAAAELAAAVA